MRDRLIELLKGAETKVTEMSSTPLALEEWLGIYADYLLANGVIVPPCKVGDLLYRILTLDNGTSFVSSFPAKVEPYSIYFRNIFGNYSYLSFDDFGKTVFLTKEEAEQALKGGVE